MSRINTNVSSLIAQTALGRSNSQLQTALNRLSTGLRINSGKDDPAGLIASENLRRDITAADKAITNSERANQFIATADSALSQISNLLNDIRGLVTEAANSGVLSDEQIAANQLQVDSSLEAIDRISQVTTFQGRKLLDGSLDFQSTYSAGGATVRDLDITQANLGTTGSVDVEVDITAAATQASITNNGFNPSAAVQATGAVGLATTGASITVTAAAAGAADGAAGNATAIVFQAAAGITQAGAGLALANSPGTIQIDAVAGGAADGTVGNTTAVIFQAAAGITQAAGTLTLTNGDFTITAVTDTAADGANGNNVIIDLQFVAAATSASYNAGTNTLTIIANSAGSTVSDISTAVGALAEFNTTLGTNGAIVVGDDFTYPVNTLTGGASGTLAAAYNATSNIITVDVAAGSTLTQVAAAIDGLADFTSSATAGGANRFDYNDFANVPNALGAGGSDGVTGAVYAGNTITVDVALNATVAQVATAIDGLADFTATPLTGAPLAFDAADLNTYLGELTGGANAGVNDVLAADLVLKVAGFDGSEVFTFQSGATLNQVVSAVNLVSDSIGVEAVAGVGAVEFRSTAYGSAAFVDLEVFDEGTGGLFEAGLAVNRDTGTDVVANVNGFAANGKGNSLSINTAVLDFTLIVADGSATDVNFTIGGGGGLFQLGPNVVGNQQARVGIASVNTAKLGGIDGRLYQLRSGGTAALDTDPTTAYRITDAAISKVTSIRGRFGAFQRTTIETNIASLKNTITNLTEAESSIRDADFAKESAALTRAQILVQSGTAVLQIANQSPQQVLSLLRG
jgi:flagellin